MFLVNKQQKLRLIFVRWSFFAIFATMIQELPKYEDTWTYYGESLLEYVVKVADQFWNDPGDSYIDEITNKVVCESLPSSAPDIFAYNYSKGRIETEKVHMELYESDDIQRTLEAFGLECSKFWYLCLFLKWKIDLDCSAARTLPQTTKEELNRLIDEFAKLNPKAQVTNHFTTEVPATLTFTVEGSKAITICNGNTLAIIGAAINKFYEEIGEDNPFLEGFSYNETAQINLSTRTKIYLFHERLSWFINPLKAKRGFHASKDKSLLISRMIYILGICDDPKLYTDLNEKGNKQNQLKGYLSRYKHPKYWSF